jgi:hypothetical protein
LTADRTVCIIRFALVLIALLIRETFSMGGSSEPINTWIVPGVFFPPYAASLARPNSANTSKPTSVQSEQKLLPEQGSATD